MNEPVQIHMEGRPLLVLTDRVNSEVRLFDSSAPVMQLLVRCTNVSLGEDVVSRREARIDELEADLARAARALDESRAAHRITLAEVERLTALVVGEAKPSEDPEPPRSRKRKGAA